jgi:hypothetical protein
MISRTEVRVGASLDRHATEVVPLGDDPCDLAALGHERGPNGRLDHPLHRFEHGCARFNLEDVMPLLLKDLRHLVHVAS